MMGGYVSLRRVGEATSKKELLDEFSFSPFPILCSRKLAHVAVEGEEKRGAHQIAMHHKKLFSKSAPLDI